MNKEHMLGDVCLSKEARDTFKLKKFISIWADLQFLEIHHIENEMSE